MKYKIKFDKSTNTFNVLLKEFCPDVKFRWYIKKSGFKTCQEAKKYILDIKNKN